MILDVLSEYDKGFASFNSNGTDKSFLFPVLFFISTVNQYKNVFGGIGVISILLGPYKRAY